MKQLIALVPKHAFDALAQGHHAGQKFRAYNRWDQFLALLIGQLSGRKSLRDITDNLKAQGKRLYHLGMKNTSKATLAWANAEQPAILYQKLFHRLPSRCQSAAPKHKFSFQGKLYLLDATVIDLCLAVFPWAEFQQKKGAIKLHLSNISLKRRNIYASGATDLSLIHAPACNHRSFFFSCQEGDNS